ncbi:ATP-binding cassette sub- A member 1 [Geranomyces variabilis]|nr:ATP-binding cassette sub- A member 1 [Geranomyces variabilis]
MADLAATGGTVEKRNWFTTFFTQLMIMLKRNTKLQLRSRASTFSQTILAPFIFMILLLILQQADYANQRKSVLDPAEAPLQGVYGCQGVNEGSPCINIMYTPTGSPVIDNIMTTFATNNAARTGEKAFATEAPITDTTAGVTFAPSTQMGMIPVPSSAFIYDYALYSPNITKWGISFTDTPGPPRNVAYQVWYNTTNTANGTDIYGRQLVAMMRGLDEAILTVLNNQPTTLDVTLKDWPLIPPKTLSDTIIQNLGPVFFFCSEMVIFINVLNLIVTEKEHKLRHGMEMMGLKSSVYWISQFLSNSLLILIGAFVTAIFGLMMRFFAFKNTNFGVLVITFFLFGEGMLMLAFFITTLVRKARVAILIGIFVFIIGLLFESFVFSSSFVGYIWWDSGTSPTAWKILIFFPFFNFGKIFLDITTYTTGRLDTLTNTFIAGPGFAWSTLFDPLPADLRPTYGSGSQPDVPAPIDSWRYLLMNMLFYGVLTWYFDCVIPDEFGWGLKPWFFLTPEYWGLGRRGKNQQAIEWLRNEKRATKANTDPRPGEDKDVHAERLKTLDEGFSPAVRIVNLRKVYGGFIRKKTDKVAVNDLCISFEEGKLLALLGQNGAGKSTSMNILSGLTPATSGDALMYNHSVRSQMPEIRDFLGVCPQHDILFDELTAKEHLLLYAGLKGVRKDTWDVLVEDRLKAVRLWKVRDQRAGTYSGGMKRRLSLVISTIGDPKIIFMDEPTTGMDPVNRRHVWDFVEKFKKGRVIVLTTHSMEEADVLGDRIAIMAHGRMRAIGTSIALKRQHGSGYRVSIIVDPENTELAKRTIAGMVPSAVLEDDSAGALLYQFPPPHRDAGRQSDLAAFIGYLEGSEDEKRPKNEGDENAGPWWVKAWGISQTTLEEVFLRLIRDANPQGYAGYEQSAAAVDTQLELIRQKSLRGSLSRRRPRQGGQ